MSTRMALPSRACAKRIGLESVIRLFLHRLTRPFFINPRLTSLAVCQSCHRPLPAAPGRRPAPAAPGPRRRWQIRSLRRTRPVGSGARPLRASCHAGKWPPSRYSSPLLSVCTVPAGTLTAGPPDRSRSSTSTPRQSPPQRGIELFFQHRPQRRGAGLHHQERAALALQPRQPFRRLVGNARRTRQQPALTACPPDRYSASVLP